MFMAAFIHIVKLRSRLPQATYGNYYLQCLGYIYILKLSTIENELLDVYFLSTDSLVVLKYLKKKKSKLSFNTVGEHKSSSTLYLIYKHVSTDK